MGEDRSHKFSVARPGQGLQMVAAGDPRGHARRLQVQERMTRQIADTVEEILNPQGVAVVIEGNHMCSMMRGVKKQEASMVTSAMLGCFKKSDKTRNEFLSHLRGSI